MTTALEPDLDLSALTLHGARRDAGLLEAVTQPPKITRTIDGASTLDLEVADYERTLLGSGILSSPCWLTLDGLGYELVAVRKAGDGVSLTFEDSLAAKLRKQTKALSVPAASTTRRAFAIRLAREAGVPALVDPALDRTVNSALVRSASGQKSDSWAVLGELASAVQARRFSDGRRLLIGSDAWLATLTPPVALAEHTGAVQEIDFELDRAKTASKATVTVDAARWALPPGRCVKLPAAMGPASGVWVIETFERTLTSTRGTVSLTRREQVLPEPPPEAPPAVSDRGEDGLLPGQLARPRPTALDVFAGSGADIPTAPSGQSRRAAMVAWALSKRGTPYVFGAKGPNAYDCSGFVAAATRAAGIELRGGSKQQYGTLVATAPFSDRVSLLTVREALATYGAILFRMSGDPTHIAISLGDGRTVEARGRAYGCGVFGDAAGRVWTSGGIWL